MNDVKMPPRFAPGGIWNIAGCESGRCCCFSYLSPQGSVFGASPNRYHRPIASLCAKLCNWLSVGAGYGSSGYIHSQGVDQCDLCRPE